MSIKKIIAREILIVFQWLIVTVFISFKFGDRVEINVHRFYPDLFLAVFIPCIYGYLIIRGGILAIQILRNKQASITLRDKG
ncbi:MAG: hypothetical protein HQL29_01960 [Candidatus Omnitrophica bacterium]|nr:hypothetical protein [Candidatus Omnitrophota bacterium]